MNEAMKTDVPASTDQPWWKTWRVGTWVLLSLAIVGACIHQAGPNFTWRDGSLQRMDWRLWDWFIEDAAISFAYARNWAEGDGLVAFRGGERIEGYSNPLWVALMALFYPLGIDGFVSSKWMAMVFTGITVLITWRIAVEAIDEDHDHPAALMAPVVLAMFPQFAFWNASGLENSLFNLMLAGGIWRTLVEARKGGFPFSAVFFLGLAVTRPEGIMYGAWGGFLGMCFSLLQGRGIKPTLAWLATFFVPFTIYHAIRYQYFAWLFPNTYYAKLGNRPFKPFTWGQRGWKYIRNWAVDTNMGWFLPVYLVSITGLRGWRRWLFPLATLVAAVCFLYPSMPITNEWDWWPEDLPNPTWWADVRVWILYAMVLGLPLLSMGTQGWRGRMLCWGSALITLFFTLRSMGDWMNGFRWMSFLVVPASVLFSVGIYEVGAMFQRVFKRPGRWTTPGWLTAAVLVSLLGPGFYTHSEAFFSKRETGPFSVKRRVEFTHGVVDKLLLDEHIYNLDVDMGAHLYWSEHQMLDMAGLVDITISQHSYSDREVTREYVFEERKPQIAHVHGGWASNSKIPTFPDWKRDYIEIPGFGGRTLHMGNHIRRDLLMKARWQGPRERIVHFEEGVTLTGYRLPSGDVSVGKAVFLELGVQYRRPNNKEDIRLLGFLANEEGQVHTFDLPLAYDWLPPSEWRSDEVFSGSFTPVLPKELGQGAFTLGFVVMSADGRVLPAAALSNDKELPEGVMVGGRDGVAPLVATGEVRFANALRVGPPGTGEKGAKIDFDRAVAKAQEGRCREAETHWTLSWQHIPKAAKWKAEHRDELAPHMASCWARMAKGADDLHGAAKHLHQARYWDHRLPEVWQVAEGVGDRLFEQGMAARADRKWQVAYEAFMSALTANPSLSWARRYAEEMRDHRLGIDEASKAAAEAERQARLERLRKEQAERKEAAAKDDDEADDEVAGEPDEAPEEEP